MANFAVARNVFAGLFAVTCFAAAVNTAQAQFKNTPFDTNTWRQTGRDIDRARRATMGTAPVAGYDYSKIYLHNRTSQTIRVGIVYAPFQDPRSSTLAVVGQSSWSTAWYTLRPNQKIHAFSSSNRYFYVYGESNSLVWSGSNSQRIGNRVVGTTQVDTGHKVVKEWTYNFRY